ncbi:MAG: FkbM family methyltransferase [Luteimonas sp.]
MGIVNGFRSHYRLFGLRGVALVARCRMKGTEDVIEVRTDGYTGSLHLRLRTSDVSVFEEVILNAEYDLPQYLGEPRFIVDAGANIGLTSIFFARRFPHARIIAIEPEGSNFELLLKNIRPYPRITPLKAALWNEDAPIRLVDPGIGKWGFQATGAAAECGTDSIVPGVTMSSLLARYKAERVDILKVDIEGAEKEVFAQADDWIGRVDIVMVETHDRCKAGCSQSVDAATGSFMHRTQRGETLVLSRLPSHLEGGPRNPAQPGEDFVHLLSQERPLRSRIVAAHP